MRITSIRFMYFGSHWLDATRIEDVELNF
jgi:hypothetical protein